MALLVLLPWGVRNYRTFGRVIPVKLNLFYELYQSQCLTKDGLIGVGTGAGFDTHPYHPGDGRDRYRELGEAAFLAEKRALAVAAVRAAPGDFCVRLWNRLVAATLVYVPTDRKDEDEPLSVDTGFSPAVHPGAFLAVLVLLAAPRRWHPYERTAVAVYVAWLLPYVLVSYYVRYGFPLLLVKVFLCAAAADRLGAGLAGLFRPHSPAKQLTS